MTNKPISTLSKIGVTAWRVFLQNLRAQGYSHAEIARIVANAKGGK